MLVKKIKIIVILLVIIIAGGVIISNVKADDTNSVVSDINKKIAEQKAKLDELTNKIKKYENDINEVRNQKASLQNQLYIINNQIAKLELDVEAKEEEIKAVELEIEKVTLEITDYENEIEKSKEKLSAFIRRLSIYDDRQYLEVLLANDSFSDFFDQVKYLEGIEKDLQKTLNKIKEILDKLNQKKDSLDKQKEDLSDLLNELEYKIASVEANKREKNYLISQTRSSEYRYQSLISDLKQAQASASGQISTLENKLRQEMSESGENKLDKLGAAVLSWPTSVRRLTALFHDTDYPYRHLFEHSGLDIATPMGTPIYAAESGYVGRASVGTKWYGNYVMVIHNNNLSTLYGHLSKLVVSTDDFVTKGQIIGYSGNTGFSSGPHLHFEVRYRGAPVNPQSYLP